jgi:hypothetical protein
MPELQDTALRLMRVLERHQELDALQLASLTEQSISTTVAALEELARYELVCEAGGKYSLNTVALGQLLQRI